MGLYVGFTFTPLPFLLDRAGIPIDRIAEIGSILILPGVFLFLWAPAVDVKLRRRTWLVMAALGTAICTCAAFPLIGASHLVLLTSLLLLAGVFGSLVIAACGGLMVRTLAGSAQDRAAAWNQAGYLGGGAVGGAAVIWLADRYSNLVVGLVLAALIALPGLAALTIAEPAPRPAAWFHGRLGDMIRELRTLFRSPIRRWSALLLLSPLGAGAAQSLLPALASRYGVGASGVMWVNGIAGGVALALGSLSGALVPSTWDRRFTYAAGGFMNAGAALVLLVATRPRVFFVGSALYLLTQGFCYARSVALMVEIVGPDTQDASTFYCVLNAMVTLPLFVMLWLDGVGFRKFGTRGLLCTDALGNILVFAVVVLIFVVFGLSFRRSTPLQS